MDNTILKKAENQVRQQLFGGLALLVATLMIGNALGVVHAVGDNTNVSFNVSGGAFTLTNAPTAVNFPAMNFGESDTAHVGAPETDNLIITDYRGTSTIWNVTVNATEMNNTTADAVIAANKLSIKNGDKGNNANADTNRVAITSNGTLNGTGTSLANGSTQASGVFDLGNAAFTLNVLGNEAATEYTGTIVYTVA